MLYHYIKELAIYNCVSTGSTDVKNMITAYLDSGNVRYTCEMDDCYQYTIKLVREGFGNGCQG